MKPRTRRFRGLRHGYVTGMMTVGLWCTVSAGGRAGRAAGCVRARAPPGHPHPGTARRRAPAARGRALPRLGQPHPRPGSRHGTAVRPRTRRGQAAGQGHQPGQQTRPVQGLDRPAVERGHHGPPRCPASGSSPPQPPSSGRHSGCSASATASGPRSQQPGPHNHESPGKWSNARITGGTSG